MREPIIIVVLVIIGGVVLYLLNDIGAKRRWRRERVEERPALDDAGFLAALSIGRDDAHLAIAVRRVVADSIGLPSESLYPSDPLGDLWRMRWDGPDLLDLIFRLERSLGVKIRRTPSRERLWKEAWSNPPKNFGTFVAAFVADLGTKDRRDVGGIS